MPKADFRLANWLNIRRATSRLHSEIASQQKSVLYLRHLHLLKLGSPPCAAAEPVKQHMTSTDSRGVQLGLREDVVWLASLVLLHLRRTGSLDRSTLPSFATPSLRQSQAEI